MEVALLVLWTVTGVIMLVLASAAFGGAGLGWGLLTLLVLHLLFFFPRVLFTFLLAPPLLALNVLCWPLRLFGLGLADPFFLLRGLEKLQVRKINKSIINNKLYNNHHNDIIYVNNYDFSSTLDFKTLNQAYAHDPDNHWHTTMMPTFVEDTSNVWHNTLINPKYSISSED